MHQKSGSHIHQPQSQPWGMGESAQSPKKRLGTGVFGCCRARYWSSQAGATGAGELLYDVTGRCEAAWGSLCFEPRHAGRVPGTIK